MRSVLVRCVAAAAAASLFLAIPAVSLAQMGSGHPGTSDASMSCPPGAACGMTADCSGTCPATIDAVHAVRDAGDLLRFHPTSVNLLLNTVTPDLQKPPPKLT
jgi:hypothetical protein